MRRRPKLRPALFAEAREGVAAVEFALILPVLLVVVLGTYEVGEAVAAYRKVTLTARTLANLTSQYTTMTASDVSNVLNASTQVMAPFGAASISIVLTEFSTSTAGTTTVTWSQALNGTPLTAGATAALPPGVAQLGTSILLASVSYSYAPVVHYYNGSFPMSSQTYMFPRSTQSVTYSGS